MKKKHVFNGRYIIYIHSNKIRLSTYLLEILLFNTIPRESIGSHAYAGNIYYKDFWRKIPEADKNIIFINQQNAYLIQFYSIQMGKEKVKIM